MSTPEEAVIGGGRSCAESNRRDRRRSLRVSRILRCSGAAADHRADSPRGAIRTKWRKHPALACLCALRRRQEQGVGSAAGGA